MGRGIGQRERNRLSAAKLGSLLRTIAGVADVEVGNVEASGGSPGTRFRRRQRSVADGRKGWMGGGRPSATRWRRCNAARAAREQLGERRPS